jgi:hypothetical protein
MGGSQRISAGGPWQLLASQRADNGLYYASPSVRISTGPRGLARWSRSAPITIIIPSVPLLDRAGGATGFNPFTGGQDHGNRSKPIMSNLTATPEFQLNLLVAGLPLLMTCARR